MTPCMEKTIDSQFKRAESFKLPKSIVISKDKIHFYRGANNDYDQIVSHPLSAENSKLMQSNTNPVSEQDQEDFE